MLIFKCVVIYIYKCGKCSNVTELAPQCTLLMLRHGDTPSSCPAAIILTIHNMASAHFIHYI